ASPLLGIKTNFDIDWDLPANGDLSTPSNLTVGLNNITLDASKFLGQSLADALNDIREVVEPVDTATQPFVTPLPGLDILSDDSFNLGDFSRLGIAEKFGVVPPGVRSGIQALHRVYQGLQFAAAGGLALGSISITNKDVFDAGGAPNLDAL